MSSVIKKDTLQFLSELNENNNRDWFNKNKDRYVAANENFVQYIQSVINEHAQFDKSLQGLDAKNTVFRIYRDTRFAKDKSPYKPNFGAALLFGRKKGWGIAGYYLHLQPGNSFLAGGVHNPEPAHIKAIRYEISNNGEAFLKIINDRSLKDNFELKGEKLVKVPQGFEKDDPMAEYLKYKELMIHHPMDDKTIVSDHFTSYCVSFLKKMIPFNAFLNASLA
jgi:uncharacterized protein (TIGR02453 family)